MNINEPKHYGYTGLKKSGKLIRSSFFLYAKIAGAHKSSPAIGNEKGCSCEGHLAHMYYLSQNDISNYNPCDEKMQPLILRDKALNCLYSYQLKCKKSCENKEKSGKL